MTAHQILGAGGHAKCVVEICIAGGGTIGVFIDPTPCSWLAEARHIPGDQEAAPDDGPLLIGLGGVTPKALSRRLDLVRLYRRKLFSMPPVQHPAATISVSAQVDEGAHVLAAAVVQPDAQIGMAAIVNTSAIVEHDAHIGSGSHIAPNACVLGGASVGEAALIGAGAVVLPGASVPDGALVPALSVYGTA